MFFFFNDTATTEIYTLSLHDALPIYPMNSIEEMPTSSQPRNMRSSAPAYETSCVPVENTPSSTKNRRKPRSLCRYVEERSEEHTSELQSRQYLVCRLLLEKKKITSWD